MKALVVLVMILTACGAEEPASQAPATAVEQPNTQLEPERGMQGPKGDTGPQGPKGDKGDEGIDGVSVQGDKGTDGKDGQPVAPNTWFDAMTGDSWIYGADLSKAQVDAADPCGGDYRLPTKEEAIVAVTHGLIVAIDNATNRVWTSSQFLTQRYYVTSTATAPSSATNTDTATIVCVSVSE